MKTANGVLLFAFIIVVGWGCSESSTSQEPDPNPYPPDAISHLPPASEIVAQDSLYKIIPDSLLTGQQKQQLTNLVESNKYYLSAHLARVNPNAKALLKQADTLAFPISKDSAYVAIKNYFNIYTSADNPTSISWGGKVPPRSIGKISVYYTPKVNAMDGQIIFQRLFIVGLILQNMDHNTLAIIQVKRPPFHEVTDVVL